MKIIIVLSVLVCLFLGCSEKPKKQDKTPPNEASPELKEMLLESEMESNENKFTLLSIKYGIDQPTTRSIFSDYFLERWDLLFRGMDPKDKPQHKKTLSTGPDVNWIKALSTKYSIPENKLASMIIDFEIWDACKEKSE